MSKILYVMNDVQDLYKVTCEEFNEQFSQGDLEEYNNWLTETLDFDDKYAVKRISDQD